MRLLALALVVPVSFVGCVVDVVDGGGNDVVASNADGPLIGVSGAGDFADRSCQIVLRDFGRVVTNSGASFAQNGSRWIFEGRVDVKKTALAEGYSPMILWKAGSDPGWRALAPVASTSIDDDSDRFLFHVDDGDLPGPGISATGLARSTIQLVPFLTRDQTRLFDHNRVVDAFASYVMNQASGFAVGEDSAVCAEADGPTLTFHGDFTEEQSGPVVAGRSVVVDYDISRNSPCRQTYNGLQTWSVMAHATFLPMNVRQSASVVNHGTSPSSSMPASFFAPEGATEMVLYFQNNDRGGCSSYDSDFGANYHFAVSDQGPEWMGNVSALIARGADRRCDGAVSFGSKVSFGSWARQRAAMTDLCFEVYEPGVTDFDPTYERGDLWQQLDVQVHHRFDPTKPFATDYVSFVDRVGNNARYAFDLRPFDPFTWGKCWSDVPLTSTTEPDGSAHVQATLEVYFTVNGEELRPDVGAGGGGVFRAVYDEAANAPHISCE